MLYRLCLIVLFAVAAVAPRTSAEDFLAGKDLGVADCTWKPFKIFTNGYVQAPQNGTDEPLYLRKEPSEDAVLPGTEPFGWPNAACNLWPGIPVRIADWGAPDNRFAKIYYDGLVFWVSKTWSDGSPTLLPIAPRLSADKEQSARKPE